MAEDHDGPKGLGDVLLNLPAVRTAKKVNTLSRVHRRLIEPLEDDGNDPRLAFQHTVFCQTGLPYRNPGDEVRVWHRSQGRASLRVEAGAINLRSNEWQEVGLPWGVKPRLILAHLNSEALRQGKAEIEVESSLSAFVKRIRGFDGGREIRAFKDQLTRLSAATIRLAVSHGEQPAVRQVNTQIVKEFDVWLEKDERQRVLWPSTINLDPTYFASLQAHAVPLYEDDLAALAHSAMAIDLYSWLAQRLHRVPPQRPAFVTWAALKEQFGPGYGRMDHFKTFFRRELRQVLARYDRARLDLDGQGMTLHHSLPPVTKRQLALPPKSST
jgi:hypothetical protein